MTMQRDDQSFDEVVTERAPEGVSPSIGSADTELAADSLAKDGLGSSSGRRLFEPLKLRSTESVALAAIFPSENRYIFGEVFARGGLGQVRRAFDQVLGRTVAVKETLGNANAKRFLREAQVTAQLEHPGIVPVHDIGFYADGEPYYCMKLIDGTSLEEMIRRAGSFAERMALLANVTTVAEAVAFAHGKGIIHRDIKPANIMIGKFGETWLIDWGLAGFIRGDDSGAREHSAASAQFAAGDDLSTPEERERLTRTGEWMGTLPYMPPEQMESAALDERADVYSVGAVLYHTLSAARPYSEIVDGSLMIHMLEHPPVDILVLAPDTPLELATIVRKAMARDRTQRYATASELANDLRRFQTGRLVRAHTYSVAQILRRWARKYRAVMVAVLTAAAALIAVLIYSVREIAAERDVATRQAELANEQRIVADGARREITRKADDERVALSALLYDDARQRLFDERQPLDAIRPLVRALELTPERTSLRYSLAESLRPLEALRCTARGGIQNNVVLAQTHPFALLWGENTTLEARSTNDCSRVWWSLPKGGIPKSLVPSVERFRFLVLSDAGWRTWQDLALDGYDLQTGEHVAQEYYFPAGSYSRGWLSQPGSLMVLDSADHRPGVFRVLDTQVHGAHSRWLDVAGRSARTAPSGSIWAVIETRGVVVRDFDEEIAVWPATRGKRARELLAVGAKGEVLVQMEHDGSLELLRVGHAATPLERCQGEGRSESPSYETAAFHVRVPVVVARTREHHHEMWNTTTGRCIASVRDRRMDKLIFAGSNDGEYVLSRDRTRLSIWRVGEDIGLKEEMALSVHQAGISDFDVDTASGTLVTLGQGGDFKVWNFPVARRPAPAVSAPHIALSPMGTSVVVADAEGVRVGTPFSAYAGQSLLIDGDVDGVNWLTDEFLAVVRGRHVELVHAPTGRVDGAVDVRTCDDLQGEYSLVGNRILVVKSDIPEARSDDGLDVGSGHVHVYDTRSDAEAKYAVGRGRKPGTHVSVSASGSRAIISSAEALIDTSTLEQVSRTDSSAVFTPGTDRFLDEAHGELKLYDGGRSTTVETLERRSDWAPDRWSGGQGGGALGTGFIAPASREHVPVATFSASGGMFVNFDHDPFGTVWKYPDYSHLSHLDGHWRPVVRAVWSPDGSRLVTIGIDGRGQLWDPLSGGLIAEFSTMSANSGVEFARSGAWFLYQDREDRLLLAESESGRRILAFDVNSLQRAVFDASEEQIGVVEGTPGRGMSLRVLEIHEEHRTLTELATKFGEWLQ